MRELKTTKRKQEEKNKTFHFPHPPQEEEGYDEINPYGAYCRVIILIETVLREGFWVLITLNANNKV